MSAVRWLNAVAVAGLVIAAFALGGLILGGPR